MTRTTFIEPPGSLEEPHNWRTPPLMWGIVFVVSTFVGLVFAARYYFFSIADAQVEFSLSRTAWVVVGWWIWILLAPLVLYLARRFPLDRGQWFRMLAAHLIGWVVISFLDVTLFSLIRAAYSLLTGGNGGSLWSEFTYNLIASISVDLLVYWAIVAVSYAFDYQRKYREREVRTSQLQAQLAEARFQALEMQLHPHFLFNTLNAISALMDEDIQASRNMLTLLSELLRLTLDHVDTHDVSVRQEIAFVGRYLEIQQIRFQDKLHVSIDMEPGTTNARVPTLILQPLVENAVLHGAAPHGQPSRVAVHVFREDNNLVMQVTDNGPGLDPNGSGKSLKTGIGLRNTQERLKQLYGRSCQLLFETVPDGGLCVTVRIPFYTEADTLEAIS